MSSLLESRSDLLHLRTILDWQRIHKKVYQTKTGCTLYPEVRDKERTQWWCSTWQNWRTKRVTYGLECVEEMLQESWLSRWTFHRYSRSILRDPVYRESQLAIGWTEQKCKELDDHTYRLTPEEKRRYKGQWYLTLNKEGKNGLMKLRSDNRAAVIMKNRLQHESGEPIEEPLSPEQYRR